MTDRGSPSAETRAFRVRLLGLTRSVITLWALAGGFLLVGIVLLTAYSAGMNILFHQPVPGDFEIVEVGVAVAVSTFLPYCQLTYSNVTVDVFTMWAGPKLITGLSLLASIVAMFFAALLLWRMSAGMIDYREYQEYTAINGFPLWMAFPPFLISLLLLFIASLVTASEAISDMRSPAQGGDGVQSPAA